MYDVYAANGRPKELYDMGCIESMQREGNRKRDEAHDEDCKAAPDRRARNKNILIDVMRYIMTELFSALSSDEPAVDAWSNDSDNSTEGFFDLWSNHAYYTLAENLIVEKTAAAR
eukprot:15919529-Heterocapsa_arctica.AAC.1